MNYFEFYDIKPSFLPDESLIKKKFLELSRKYHPDHFVHTSDAEKEEAETLASSNNKAYEVLSNPLLRLKYILSTYYSLDDEATNALDQDFLMSMMDLHDLISEDPIEARKVIDQLKTEWLEAILPSLSTFDPDHIETTQMDKVRDYYFKMKYVSRLEKNLEGMIEM